MRIALIGDIHAYRLFLMPWQLAGKRLLGQANLWLNRRHKFDHRLIDRLIEQVNTVSPDLVLLSGDLTTTSLEGEFEDVARILGPLTRKYRTLIVPGNHDRYTFTSARRRVMESMLSDVVPASWPHFQRLHERWHLLALDSAVPRVFNSRGRVGRHQMRHVQRYLSDLTPNDGLVVLCHYPLKSPPRALPLTWDHALADSRRLRQLLTHCPARLVYMHGHIHKPWCWQPKHNDQAHFTYINAGSPCMVSAKHPCGQGFWQIDLPGDPWDHLNVTHHLPMPNGQRVRGKSPEVQQWQAHRIL